MTDASAFLVILFSMRFPKVFIAWLVTMFLLLPEQCVCRSNRNVGMQSKKAVICMKSILKRYMQTFPICVCYVIKKKCTFTSRLVPASKQWVTTMKLHELVQMISFAPLLLGRACTRGVSLMYISLLDALFYFLLFVVVVLFLFFVVCIAWTTFFFLHFHGMNKKLVKGMKKIYMPWLFSFRPRCPSRAAPGGASHRQES